MKSIERQYQGEIDALKIQAKDIRRALADYINSEGCSCCRKVGEHNEAARVLAELLDVPRYKDDSGYDFNQFATKPLQVLKRGLLNR